MSAAILFFGLLAFGVVASTFNVRVPGFLSAPLFVLAGCAGATVSDGDACFCSMFGVLLAVVWWMVASDATGRKSCAKG